MGKQIYISAAIILFICLIGIMLYTYFEIYPVKKEVYPSKQAFNNNYLALDRWLKKTGHNIRITNDFSINNIEEANEKVIIIDFWFFYKEEIIKIIEWIKTGHYLVVLENFIDNDPELTEFFNEYDIFEEDFNKIKFAEIQIGDGAISLVDTPYFMQNDYLSNELNAQLAWKLTGARTDAYNMDILFVREPNWDGSKSFFGAIIERGNLKPIIISSLILIFVGFWMVIPVFGLVFNEKIRNSRPIKDRFTAEIRFLKKYKALDYYLDINEHTNKNKESEYSYKELINQYRRRLNGNAEN